MKLEFNIHGTFEFDFSEKRQKELIRDAKNYPGGITALLLDNLEVARLLDVLHLKYNIDFSYNSDIMILFQEERERRLKCIRLDKKFR